MFRAFKRAWWVENPDWPDGLEPGPGPRRKGTSRLFDTEQEAREFCQDYNATHNPGRLSVKYEFEEVRS